MVRLVLMPSDRRNESSVFTSGPNKVNTMWSLPGPQSRTDRSSVTLCLCFYVIWLAQSFRVLHPAGTKSNGSPEGSNCDSDVSSSENNTRTCLFLRSSSIRKPRPAASQTFGRKWTHGRPTTAANQRAPFPEFEGRNNKLWLEEMLILVSVCNRWIKCNEVHLTHVYQTCPPSIQRRSNDQSISFAFWVDQYKINKVVLSSDDEFNIILDFWLNKTINI